MALELQPPDSQKGIAGKHVVFLAGSIEQGNAEPWQSTVVDQLGAFDCVLLNPRRSDWNPDLPQHDANNIFREQVEWELDGLELADTIAVYFDPQTKSPVTLLEVGLFARTGKLIVCCPEGFWRKGNVDIVCRRYSINTVDTLEDLILTLRSRVAG